MDLQISLFVFSLVSWLAFEAWRQLRDRRRVTIVVRDDRRTIWLTTGATLLGVVLGLVPNPLSAHWGMPWRSSMVAFAIGIALMWLGLALRLWAIRALGRYFRSTVVIQEGHRVVTSGPYRWVRHPSYTGALLTGLGAGLAVGNWFALVAFLALPLAAYVARILVEESALVASMGDEYRSYAGASRRLLPYVW
jgi:protein-S-isoprenylcysteine O-methyltransferase Ste14